MMHPKFELGDTVRNISTGDVGTIALIGINTPSGRRYHVTSIRTGDTTVHTEVYLERVSKEDLTSDLSDDNLRTLVNYLAAVNPEIPTLIKGWKKTLPQKS